MNYLIPLLLLLFLTSCLPPKKMETYVEAVISVQGERLSLSPLISEAKMEDLPNWPKDPEQQKLLLKNFHEIWNKLLAEFRRGEKYGQFIMVEDNENPTFRISITLTEITFLNDTLILPVKLQAERLRDDQRFLYTLPAKAAAARKKDEYSFHYYGQILSNYRFNFPYREIVSFFYLHKLEKY